MRSLLTLLLVPAIAYAVPMELTHQGRALDASGTPIEGAHTVNIDVFAAPTGGSDVWSSDFSVSLTDGYYTVVLGVDDIGRSLSPAQLTSGVYLQVGVDTVALGDRIPLRSTPTAIAADTATNLVGGTVDATEFRLNGTLLIDADGELTLSAVPDLPASQITSGTLDSARLDVGTQAGQVAAGDHGHNDLMWSQTGFMAQIQAQAACVALNGSTGSQYTFAVPRTCTAEVTPTCATVCGGLSESQAGQLACFDSLHIYTDPPTTQLDQRGLKTVRYFGCGGTGCGPNFCCCRG